MRQFQKDLPTDGGTNGRIDRQRNRTHIILQDPSSDGQESKERIRNSSKTISSRSLNNKYFENIHLNLTKLHFQNQQDLP